MSNQNIYSYVKECITTRSAAEAYGIEVSHNGMAVCPFHGDKNPSMKVDENFTCFACGEKGDVITFVSKLFGLAPYEAARKIAEDFCLNIPDDFCRKKRDATKHPQRSKITETQFFNKAVDRAYNIYCDYYRLLGRWLLENKDLSLDIELRPYYLAIIQLRDNVERVLDILLYGGEETKASIINIKGREVNYLERRIKEFEAGDKTSLLGKNL